MLIGINPALNADILYTLASMGHGDKIVLCDANFPAASVASHTNVVSHIESGLDAITMLEAVLSIFPIDKFDPHIPPVEGMQVVGAPNEIAPIIAEAKPILQALDTDIKLIERHSFYENTKKAYAIIRTNEPRPYGNFIIRKGVVGF
ncbi:MAG: RbsD/FucU family protein [Nitratireductor sp.]